MKQFDDIEVSVESKNRKRNIVRYLLLCFAALVYAFFFGGLFPYTLLYLMLALPVMSVIHLFIVCFFLRLSELTKERTFVKGDRVSYNLILQNPTLLYIPYIVVRMQMEGQFILKGVKSMRISLAPFSKREFKYEMPLFFRGRYEIGVSSIEIQDLLGIIKYRIYPLEKKSILVKPRIMELNFKDIPAARISEGNEASGLQEVGNEEIKDIREYSYGDSFRKIHWKLTSKLSKTMVKETHNELDNNVLLILNLNEPEIIDEESLKREDCIVEEMVSIIHYLLRRNIPVKLCFYRDDRPFSFRASSLNEFNSLYLILSEIKFNEDYVFEEVVDYFSDIEQHSKLVYIFSVNLDGNLISKSQYVRNKGFDVELYYVSISDIADDDFKAKNEMADVLMKSNIKGNLLQPRALDIEAGKEEILSSKVNPGREEKAYETQA